MGGRPDYDDATASTCATAPPDEETTLVYQTWGQ